MITFRRRGAAEQGVEPDYRFSLANERTFLAYLRTALALDAGGLAVVQLLNDVGSAGPRQAAGVVLIALGLVIAVAGYRRCRVNQRAMRLGEPLPGSSLGIVLIAAVGVVSALAIVLVFAV